MNLAMLRMVTTKFFMPACTGLTLHIFTRFLPITTHLEEVPNRHESQIGFHKKRGNRHESQIVHLQKEVPSRHESPIVHPQEEVPGNMKRMQLVPLQHRR
mmetsp:Transcript_43431/g.69447  ORF Transcript_43431/g.69447 Transcript_43431/m.69447 type:complete len:100 (-) Transcript_43431:103-402(-)